MMSNFEQCIEQLNVALKALHLRWEETKAVWNDPVSRDFEGTYLALLDGDTRVTLQEMQKLAQVVAEARRRIR